MSKSLLVASGFVTLSFLAAYGKGDNPHWFSEAEIQAIIKMEPPPPGEGTAADRADVQAVADAEAHRTEASIAEAQLDAGYSVQLFAGIAGPKINPANDPATFEFFDELNGQIAQVVNESKQHWHRLRPYQAHGEIHALFPTNGFSYPSGHSTHSYAFAAILGDLFPGKAAAFKHRADLIAQSRVDAGVHYVTDIREGELLGSEIIRELMAKPAFLEKFHAVQAELAGKK